MKKLITALSLFFCLPAFPQNFSITSLKSNVLYIGVFNSIDVSVTGYKADEIDVKATNGRISVISGKYYSYQGIEPGSVAIIVYAKESGQEICRSNFRVKYIPVPVPKLGNVGSGNIPDSVLKSKKYLRAEVDNFDYDVVFNIDSFTVNVIHKKGRNFKEAKNVTNKFGSSVLHLLGKVKKGDIVIFKNIYALSPDGRSIQLSPLVFTVSN